MQELEGLYYLCSENKGADQLRGDCEADLRLCFRICKNPVFSQRDTNQPMQLQKLASVKFLNFWMPEKSLL